MPNQHPLRNFLLKRVYLCNENLKYFSTMNSLKWIASILVCFFFLNASAQEGSKIKFDETTHQFGKIKKNDPAEHVFTFTNVSEAPVKLSRVKASCGCTTPSWTREEVKPGEKGEIAVKYNTARVGAFTKTVTVTYDETERPIILYIRGSVEGGETAIENVYVHRQGGLGFQQINQGLGTLDSDKKKILTFKAKNLSPQPINFTGKTDSEMMMRVIPSSNTVLPGEIVDIKVEVMGEKFITPGFFNKQISIYTDEANQAVKTLTVSGTLNKVMSAAEKAALPKIEFEQTAYNGGVVLEGEQVEVKYAFTNTGKSDLVIESVKASCGCTASAPKDKIIKPGQSSEIAAKFNSRGRQGKQSKSITVRTNDPENSTIILRLNVEVERNPFHVESVGPAESGGVNNR